MKLLALVAMAACSGAPVSAPAGVGDAPVAWHAPTLQERLRPYVVSDDDYYRRVLYTWTSSADIANLRGSQPLLVATATSGTFMSPFNRAILALAGSFATGAPIARLIASHPALIRHRYAWPALFATVMGLGERTYGTSIVRMELRPEAWIGRFDPQAKDPFSFVDASGKAVSAADVMRAPERLGAIFHVRTEAAHAIPFREYVICSPAMIESWSANTPGIREEVDTEAALLGALRDPLRDNGALHAWRAWSHAPAGDDLGTLWQASLAFDNPRYRADRRRLDAIIAALTAYNPVGAALSVP